MGHPTGHRRSAVPIDSGSVDCFHVQIGGGVFGPYSTLELRKLPGFTLQTPVCPIGSQQWVPAFTAINLKLYANPSTSSRPVPTWTEMLEELILDPMERALRVVFRWGAGLILIALLLSLGVGLLRRSWPTWGVAQVKAQGHHAVTYLIKVLRDVDTVWFSAPDQGTTRKLTLELRKLPEAVSTRRRT